CEVEYTARADRPLVRCRSCNGDDRNVAELFEAEVSKRFTRFSRCSASADDDEKLTVKNSRAVENCSWSLLDGERQFEQLRAEAETRALRGIGGNVESHASLHDVQPNHAAIVEKPLAVAHGQDGEASHGSNQRPADTSRCGNKQDVTPSDRITPANLAHCVRPAVFLLPSNNAFEVVLKLVRTDNAECHGRLICERGGRPIDEVRESINERGFDPFFGKRGLGLNRLLSADEQQWRQHRDEHGRCNCQAPETVSATRYRHRGLRVATAEPSRNQTGQVVFLERE
ncbi:MAG TPA: hypothetical protein VJP86_11255, partial [Vicinamibacterales bacterium]|nr:hypothetical protein [Vicinamibacterales bacterium]